MKNKPLKYIIIIIFLIYISSYYIANNGYYEYSMQQRTILTNQKIKEFEKDIKDNNDIDIKNYLAYEEIDYTNNITNIVYNISEAGTKLTRKIIKYIFKKLNYLIED